LLGKRHRPAARPSRRRIDDVSREGKTHTMRARARRRAGVSPAETEPALNDSDRAGRACDSHCLARPLPRRLGLAQSRLTACGSEG
jgi:hypothetical protein